MFRYRVAKDARHAPNIIVELKTVYVCFFSLNDLHDAYLCLQIIEGTATNVFCMKHFVCLFPTRSVYLTKTLF